jgi:hypothetical protein
MQGRDQCTARRQTDEHPLQVSFLHWVLQEKESQPRPPAMVGTAIVMQSAARNK